MLINFKDFLIYFKSDTEDCYIPLINASFLYNMFDIDLNNARGGFTLENDLNYKHPFPNYINFGFAAKCEASLDSPFITYIFGIYLFFI